MDLSRLTLLLLLFEQTTPSVLLAHRKRRTVGSPLRCFDLRCLFLGKVAVPCHFHFVQYGWLFVTGYGFYPFAEFSDICENQSFVQIRRWVISGQSLSLCGPALINWSGTGIDKTVNESMVHVFRKFFHLLPLNFPFQFSMPGTNCECYIITPTKFDYFEHLFLRKLLNHWTESLGILVRLFL